MSLDDLNRYHRKIEHLTRRLDEFTLGRDNGILFDAKNPLSIYTCSIGYLSDVIQYHRTPDMARFILSLLDRIEPGDSIVDAGCASGFTGLSLAQYGRERVTFHDFPGVGLEFLSWFIKTESLKTAKVVAYGQPIEQHQWCLACDMLEHTGNHLATLRWLSTLGQKVALCYPLSVPFSPPYVRTIDEWVDDEMIQAAIARRNTIIETDIRDGRRYTIYEVIQ